MKITNSLRAIKSQEKVIYKCYSKTCLITTPYRSPLSTYPSPFIYIYIYISAVKYFKRNLNVDGIQLIIPVDWFSVSIIKHNSIFYNDYKKVSRIPLLIYQLLPVNVTYPLLSLTIFHRHYLSLKCMRIGKTWRYLNRYIDVT